MGCCSSSETTTKTETFESISIQQPNTSASSKKETSQGNAFNETASDINAIASAKKDTSDDDTNEEKQSLINSISDSQCDLNVNECNHIQNIILYLNHHLKLSLNDERNNQRMMDVMHSINENYTVNELLRDFIHIRTHHINARIPDNILKCNDDCLSQQRYRNRRIYTMAHNDFNDDIHEINLQQSLDTIHCNLLHEITVNSSKFITNVHADGDQKMCVSTNDDSKQVDDTLAKYRNLPKYRFGYPARIAFSIGLWQNCTKYSSLKDEFISNKIHSISNLDFMCLYQKASNWMIIYQEKLPFVQRESSQKGVLKKGDHISIQHIMAIMSYCNMDELQNKYKKNGFMPQHDGELDTERLRRLSEIGIWSKSLFEAVFFFGNTFKSKNDSVFHGINAKLQFIMMGTQFKLPTSTTTSLSVAQRFATPKGIILQLYRTYPDDAVSLYFDVYSKYVLTNYPNECERIIFDTALGFKNIMYKDIFDEFDHSKVTTALYLYQQITYAKHYIYRKHIHGKKVQQQLINLMHGLMDTDNTKVDGYLLYLFECMNVNGAWGQNKLFLQKEDFEQLQDELQSVFIDQFVPYLEKQFNVSLHWMDTIRINVTKEMLEEIRSKKYGDDGDKIWATEKVDYTMSNGDICTVGFFIRNGLGMDIDACLTKLTFPDQYESFGVWAQLWIPQIHFHKAWFPSTPGGGIWTYNYGLTEFVPACLASDVKQFDSFDIEVSFRSFNERLKY